MLKYEPTHVVFILWYHLYFQVKLKEKILSWTVPSSKKFGIEFYPTTQKRLTTGIVLHIAQTNVLNKANISNAYRLLSKNIIAKHQQGKLRTQNMYLTYPMAEYNT